MAFLKLNALNKSMKNVLLANNIATNFHKSWRAKKALELVHFDLCGPINPPFNGGKGCIITFIDDLSQKNLGIFFARDI